MAVSRVYVVLDVRDATVWMVLRGIGLLREYFSAAWSCVAFRNLA
jgi:hypothetical protein